MRYGAAFGGKKRFQPKIVVNKFTAIPRVADAAVVVYFFAKLVACCIVNIFNGSVARNAIVTGEILMASLCNILHCQVLYVYL